MLVDIINENSKLPRDFLANFKDEKIDEISYIRNFMSKDYIGQEFQLKYSGYPTDASNPKLTYIRIVSNKYNVLGITVGDNIEKCKKIIDYGFIKIKENSYIYEKEDYNISVGVQDGLIKEIVLEAKTKYVSGKLY